MRVATTTICPRCKAHLRTFASPRPMCNKRAIVCLYFHGNIYSLLFVKGTPTLGKYMLLTEHEVRRENIAQVHFLRVYGPSRFGEVHKHVKSEREQYSSVRTECEVNK